MPCRGEISGERIRKATIKRNSFRGLHLRPSAIIYGCILLAGCSGYAGPRSIVNEDPAVKIPQIKSAVRADDRAALPQLIRDLDSDDAAVRFYSIEALRRMTGQTFDYDWKLADRHQRRPAVERWRTYAEAAAP